MKYDLITKTKSYPLHRPFRIARGVKDTAHTVQVILEDEQGNTGLGEAVPYPRFGESIDSVLHQIERIRPMLVRGFRHNDLMQEMAPGAARNALACALWSMQAGAPLNDQKPQYLKSAMTIAIDTPEAMAEAAKNCPGHILKIKLGNSESVNALQAIHEAVPDKDIIIDANEGWDIETFQDILPILTQCKVRLIEQPLHEDIDHELTDFDSPIPIYADESVLSRRDFPALRDRYQGVNIKLDKCGGLTEAMIMKEEALKLGFEVMLGCMIGPFRTIAPALRLIDDDISWVDLDGPSWIKDDPENPIDFQSWVQDCGFEIKFN